MRKVEMYELAIVMFAGSIFFTLMIAPNMFADQIALDPNSLYAGYVEVIGSQQNLALISLVVAIITFASFFIRNYNIRILINSIGIVFTTFITASYLFNYPNLGLGLLMVMIIWQIYEVNKLVDKSEDEKAKKILKKSLVHTGQVEKEEDKNE